MPRDEAKVLKVLQKLLLFVNIMYLPSKDTLIVRYALRLSTSCLAVVLLTSSFVYLGLLMKLARQKGAEKAQIGRQNGIFKSSSTLFQELLTKNVRVPSHIQLDDKMLKKTCFCT